MRRLLLWLLLISGVVRGPAPCVSAAEPVSSPKKGYGKVELLRDPWGIPHVFAESDAGAMYGLGHAVAEDRGYYRATRAVCHQLYEPNGCLLFP
ncbi:MAG TPA: penicillin acylase family protein [Gemmataceae bacterium]|nr:penicillin acylase family protein [Gemmataceae bacterium]